MTHSYKDQINAIQASMIGLTNSSSRYDALNDAASTIATINLNPNIFDRVRDLENQLSVMTSLCLLKYHCEANPAEYFEIEKAQALLKK